MANSNLCRTMYKISIALAIFLVPVFTFAQSGEEDVIYFKNGGILRGEIIEYTGEESLKIKTAGRNVVVVMLGEVQEIRKERVPRRRYFKESGYVNHTGMAFLPGPDATSIRFQMVNGYQFTPKLSAGLGFGLVTYNDPLNLAPLFLDVKYKFLEANTTPFAYFRSGYSFSIMTDDELQVEEHKGGHMLNMGFGLQFDTARGFGWYFTAGYNKDHSGFDQERWDGRIVENDISYRRIQFGFGLSF